MSVQAVPFWQSIRNAVLGYAIVPDHPPQRIRITESESRTLPANVREIRVFSGGAWVSSLGEDSLLYEGQSMILKRNPGSIAVTASGRKPVVLELLP